METLNIFRSPPQNLADWSDLGRQRYLPFPSPLSIHLSGWTLLSLAVPAIPRARGDRVEEHRGTGLGRGASLRKDGWGEQTLQIVKSHLTDAVFFKGFFYITVDIQYYISFMATAKWLDICINYEVIPGKSRTHLTLCVSITIACLYSLCCTLHSCDYSVTANLCCSQSLQLFHPAPDPPPIWQPSKCSLYLWVCFCFDCLFCFLDFTYKGTNMVFVFLWLNSLA